MNYLKNLFAIGLFIVTASATAWSQAFPVDNFHEVDPGKLYRSAQLSPQELQQKINELHLKTIINLRGAAPGAPWFEQEVAVAKANGMAMINIPLDGMRLPTRNELMALLKSYAMAPRPILVHCEMGADRSGLASGVYVFDVSHGNRAAALTMLSPRFLHFRQLMPAMDFFMEKIYQGSAWALQNYEPCNQNYPYFDKAQLCHR